MSPFKITGTYRYFDENGNLLYWKERVEPGRFGRSKEFRFYHGEREKGRGCEPILYRLPAVLRSKTVIINEGEKQADLLAKWGLVATSLDSGANSKLTPSGIGHLTGKRIAIIQDNDKAGATYALSIAKALQGKFESLRIILLPGLPDKGDVCDWVLEAGNDKARLLAIIKETPEWEPVPDEPAKPIKKHRPVTVTSVTITDEMIKVAKQYPIDKIIEFKQGMATCISPDHTDKRPSMYHGTKTNKAICGACGIRLDPIDAYMMLHGVSFFDAVRSLCQ